MSLTTFMALFGTEAALLRVRSSSGPALRGASGHLWMRQLQRRRCRGRCAHGAIVDGDRESGELEAFCWANTFISNAKTAITRTCRHLDFQKYRYRYLIEAQYRVNSRFDLVSLVGRMVHTFGRIRFRSEDRLRQRLSPSLASR